MPSNRIPIASPIAVDAVISGQSTKITKINGVGVVDCAPKSMTLTLLIAAHNRTPNPKVARFSWMQRDAVCITSLKGFSRYSTVTDLAR
ncbi:MAG: hypothetical protein OQK94_04790, partial [Gammaproteobacteria bacterium]|nr:hypothetical protein [Gammaproteobacteria bacterium]